MSFSEMFSILQRREQEKIVLIKLGVFYIATGKDAVLLHNELGLKCVCYKNNICKIGIPVDSSCIKNRGMHKACLGVQSGMKHCKQIWNDYYILKMDVAKFFNNIDKRILLKILKRKIKDKKVLWLTKEIIYSNYKENGIKGLPIRKLYITDICQHIS